MHVLNERTGLTRLHRFPESLYSKYRGRQGQNETPGVAIGVFVATLACRAYQARAIAQEYTRGRENPTALRRHHRIGVRDDVSPRWRTTS